MAVGTATVLLTALAGCAGSTGSDDSGSSGGLPSVIKIGVPLDLTGSSAITGVGTGEQAGVKFAIEQINKSKLLGDSKIEGVFYDTQADKTQSVSRTIQLTTKDGVKAIVGYSLTDSFLAAAPTAQKAGIPTMAVGLSGAGVTDVGDYMFRELLDFSRLFDGGDPDFLKATGGKTAAYLYGSDTVTTSGQYKHRSALLKSLGVRNVATETITATTTDMGAQLTTIKNANPDYLVINVDTGQVPQVLSQVASAGIKAQILGDNGLGSAQTLASATAVQGAQCGLFTIPWYADSQEGGNPQFVKDWKAAHGGKQPDMFNALGHDAMLAMATAIKQAGTTDGAKIRDALLNLDGFSGALGSYQWAADRQPTYKGINMRVQDGKDVVWDPKSTCKR